MKWKPWILASSGFTICVLVVQFSLAEELVPFLATPELSNSLPLIEFEMNISIFINVIFLIWQKTVIKTEGGDNETDEFNCDSADGVLTFF